MDCPPSHHRPFAKSLMRSLGIRQAGNRKKSLRPSEIGLELTPILSGSDAALRERASLCYPRPDGRSQTRSSLIGTTGSSWRSPLQRVLSQHHPRETLPESEECRLPFQSLDMRLEVGSAYRLTWSRFCGAGVQYVEYVRIGDRFVRHIRRRAREHNSRKSPNRPIRCGRRRRGPCVCYWSTTVSCLE